MVFPPATAHASEDPSGVVKIRLELAIGRTPHDSADAQHPL